MIRSTFTAIASAAALLVVSEPWDQPVAMDDFLACLAVGGSPRGQRDEPAVAHARCTRCERQLSAHTRAASVARVHDEITARPLRSKPSRQRDGTT